MSSVTKKLQINELFSRSKLIKQEKFELLTGTQTQSLSVWPSAFTIRPPALSLLIAL